MVAKIEVQEGLSQDLILGQLVQAVNALIKSSEDCHEENKAYRVENKEAHDKIFSRLEEGDQDMAVLKFSRCTFNWLSELGVFKYMIAGVSTGVSIVIGYILIK